MKRFHRSEASDKRVVRSHLPVTITALVLAAVLPFGAMSGCGDFAYQPSVSVTLPKSDEIRCKKIEVINEDDKVVVSVVADEDGAGLLTVFAADGETIVATLPMR